MRLIPVGVCIVSGLTFGAPRLLGAQEPTGPIEAEIVGHIYKPAPLEPTAERLAQVKLPDGFNMEKWAEGLGNVRMLAVSDDGTVYATRREQGEVVMLRDQDGDGRAEVQQVVASIPDVHGITVHDGIVYLATVKEVFSVPIQPDGTLGERTTIISNLPDGGQHPNRTLAVGPDGMLYISVGSSCNACTETNEEHATMLRTGLDGSARAVFASGLRNTLGFGWHPESGDLYGADHGIDWLGDHEQQEELNQLAEGARYGWPYIYADGKFNPADEPPGDTTHAQWAKLSHEPELLYEAHAAPMQMVFYSGTHFPEEYRGDAFVAMRGSWNRRPPSGYEVVRVRFENGRPAAMEPFATGFLVQQPDGTYGHLGRLAGLAVAADGSLLLGDDHNGVIYRISYETQ